MDGWMDGWVRACVEDGDVGTYKIYTEIVIQLPIFNGYIMTLVMRECIPYATA
jgi:hypothetical protein